VPNKKNVLIRSLIQSFLPGDFYVIRWLYTVTISRREIGLLFSFSLFQSRVLLLSNRHLSMYIGSLSINYMYTEAFESMASPAAITTLTIFEMAYDPSTNTRADNDLRNMY
jgi:hypothetical protein